MQYNDLSIIFQGPIISDKFNNYTVLALNSALKHFPGSEIIFSTWKESVVPNEILENKLIKVLYNIDPGSGVRKDRPITYHNVNRIIVSSIQGIQFATRKYCIKTRSDMIFDSSSSIRYFSRYNKVIDSYSFFKDKIIVSNQTSINPSYGPKLLYHICDWFFLGRREDLLKLYDIKLIDDKIQVRWYETHPKPENQIDKNNLSLFMAEDYVISEFFKKKFKIKHDFYCDYDKEQEQISEMLIVNNFVIVDNNKLGIHSGKFQSLSQAYLWKCYTYQEWKNIYSKNILGKKLYFTFHERIALLLLNLNPIHIFRIIKHKYLN